MAVEPDAWAESAARLRPVIARFCEGVSRYEFHAAACAVDPHHLSRSPEPSEAPHTSLARPLVRFAAAMELFHEFSFLAADGASRTGSLPSMIESFTEIAADAEALAGALARSDGDLARFFESLGDLACARLGLLYLVSALVVAHLKMDIASKGNTVRALKATGAERTAWGPHVDVLLAQKRRFLGLTGTHFDPPKKVKNKKGAKARAEASAPEQPVEAHPLDGLRPLSRAGQGSPTHSCMLLYLHFSAARAVVPGTNDPKPMADSQPEAVDVAEICARRVRPRGRIGQLSRRVSRHRLRELHSACEERCAPSTDEPGRTSPTSADEERRFNLSAELKVTRDRARAAAARSLTSRRSVSPCTRRCRSSCAVLCGASARWRRCTVTGRCRPRAHALPSLCCCAMYCGSKAYAPSLASYLIRTKSHCLCARHQRLPLATIARGAVDER